MTDMQYAPLGRSGINVSKVCLGGMSFGKASPDFHQWTIDQQGTEQVIGHAIDRGINFIDTANCYAFGTSEEYIGQALRNLNVARRSGGARQQSVLQRWASFQRSITERSTARSSVWEPTILTSTSSTVFDYTTPAEETMEALDALVKAGKVRALGASEMYAYQFHNLQAVADANGWTRFTSMQCHYNLLYREDERELIPVCQQYDVALTPYSPMASGHLARPAWDSNSARGTTDGTMHNKYDQAKAQDMPIVERVHEVSERHGVPMAQVALAWHWAKGVTAPIVGCSKPERVDDAIAALGVQLTEDDIAYIEEPYTAHELVGPLSRPGEKALAGTLAPTLKETTRN